MTHASVSVIVPAYNHEKYVEQAIASIAAQTAAPSKLIIIDDCSRDSTYERAVTAARMLPFESVVIRHEQNHGLCRTLNEGLALAATDFVTFLASDDTVPVTKYEEQSHFLREHPEFAAVYADMMVMDVAGTPLRVDRGFDRTTFAAPRQGFARMSMKDIALARSTGSIQSGLFRVAAAREIGGFDESLRHEDLDFNLRLLRAFSAAYLFSVGANYRATPGGMNLRFAEFEHEYDTIIGRHADALEQIGVSSREWQAANSVRKAENRLNVDRRREALAHVARSLTLDPTNTRALRCLALATTPKLVKRGAKWLLRRFGN